MGEIGHTIRYLRDCFRADTRGGGIYDLLGSKLDFCPLRDVSGPAASSLLERLPMPSAVAAEMAKAASLNRREKSLLYMAFPIVGRPAESGWLPKVLCAPLLLFPAKLEQAEISEAGFYLRLEAGEGRLNAPALGALLGGEEPAGGRLEALLGQVPEPPFGWDDLYDLVRLIEEIVPDLDAQALHRFPTLMEREDVEKAVRSARRRRDARRQCLPACALGLAPNSVETRGVLFELDQLAAADRQSPPLSILLGEPAGGDRARGPSAGDPPASREMRRAPAVLSAAQERILRSAETHALTLERVSLGESVLIACRRRQPLAVVERKIEELLQAPSFAMRAGRRSQLSRLRNHLQALLHGGDPLRGAHAGRTSSLARELRRTERRIARIEARLHSRNALEQRLAEHQLDAEPGLAGLLRSLSMKRVRWQLGRLGDHWHLLDDYERSLDQRSRQVGELLRASIRDRIRKTLGTYHWQLTKFLQALRARHSASQDRLFSRVDPEVLLHAFPLWAGTFAGAHRAIPRFSGLFDVVIIDEATQCDLASCLPIIDRGKRLVVAGDPHQLRHVSFLSSSRQRLLAERHGISAAARDAFDYRRKSLLDRTSKVLESIDQTALLGEGFRSSPQIIAFSNREFYRGALRIMTRRPETAGRRAIEVRRIDGRRDRQGASTTPRCRRWLKSSRRGSSASASCRRRPVTAWECCPRSAPRPNAWTR